MYVPPAFEQKDASVLKKFMSDYPFATLISPATGDVTHMPLLLREDGAIEGHMARNNPHRKSIEDGELLMALFHGPHAYLSPTWYEQGREAVPTWNLPSCMSKGKRSPLKERSS